MESGEGLQSDDAPSGARSTSFWARVREHKIIQWGVGYLGAAFALAQGGEVVGNAFHWPDVVGRILDDPAAARAAVRKAYAGVDQSVMPIWRVLARLELGAPAARFGDPELAMTSFEETFASSPEQVYAIWRPVYRDMRKLPRFKMFVRQIGLVDYWKQYGWPDACRTFGENDFECD